MQRQEEINYTNEELLNLYLSLPKDARVKRFADTAQTAELIGMSQRTVQFWAEIGTIRAVRVGGKLKVDLDSVTTYLKNAVKNRELDNSPVQ